MSNRILVIFLIIAVVGILLLLAINSSHLFSSAPHKGYLSRGETRGIELYHQGKPYTLNFEQQESLIDLLNRATPVEKVEVDLQSKPPLDFEKIVIYRFNAPNIILTPIGYKDNQLLFSVPEWSQKPFQDNSQGTLRTLLSHTYDS